MKKKYLRMLSPLAVASVVIGALLYLSGAFITDKIEPGREDLKKRKDTPFKTAIVKEKTVDEFHEAVGTIQSRILINVSSQVSALVKEVLVNVGQSVKKGDLLVRLDKEAVDVAINEAKEELEAVKAANIQAMHSLEAAKALFNQSRANYKRMKNFHEQEVITDQQMEEHQADYDYKKQRVEQAKQMLRQSEARIRATEQKVRSAIIRVGYTLIKAVEDGVVVEKKVEPGDLALPGKLLLVIQNPKSLRLEANIRENLIQKISIGDELTVIVDAVNQSFKAIVDEIVPSADPKSRSFLVKAALPSDDDLYPGMFGRLLVPIMKKQVIVAPLESIYIVGQLEMVNVLTNGCLYKRYVRTGKQYNDVIEILSGLKKNEIVIRNN